MGQRITQTIGVDLGDRFSRFCVVEQATGDEIESGRIRTTPKDFEQFFAARPCSRVVMEVGTHSPWASRVAAGCCAQVYVANARELHFIYKNSRKSDAVDAAALARVGRMEPALLAPIRHRGAQAQRDLAQIRARDALVRCRTGLVNTLRGLVKSAGHRIPKRATTSMGYRMRDELPEALRETLTPLLLSIEFLTDEIQSYDREIERLAEERYPETKVLRQVPGVGPLTATAFVLTLEDANRYGRNRDVAAHLGLVPRRDQSGDVEKQLHISKEGDRLVRTLLVQCAHHILQPRSPESDLKRFGERLAARGGPRAKRKAVVAVARKLAVLLCALWRTGEVYEPNRNQRAA
jgi:transposase